MRKSIIDDVLEKQQADGGWTLDSLGSWRSHAKALLSTGGNSYATAFAAFALRQAGIPQSDRRLALALDWLKSHQNRVSGYWDAVSMNKQYEAGSMPARFMQDAATSFGVLALLEDQ